MASNGAGIVGNWIDNPNYAEVARGHGTTVKEVKRRVHEQLRRNQAMDGAQIALADPFRLIPKQSFVSFNPSELVQRKGYGVIEKMRRDDQVKAALTFKKNTVLAAGWEIVSPKDEDGDWEVRRFVEDEFKRLAGTLNDTLFEIMSAFDYGFSVAEKVFAPIAEGEFADKIGLAGLNAKRPNSFKFDTDEFGSLKDDGLIQEQPDGDKRLPVGKFVLFAHQKEFANYYGVSDLVSTYRPWWSKWNTFNFMMMFIERLGIPPIFALFDPNAYNPAQIDDLQSVISDIQAATFGSIPRPNKDALEFWSPEAGSNRATQVFIPAINMLDTHIARSILMPSLLGLTPEQQTGSLARARITFDIFLQVIAQIQKRIEETVMFEQIIKPLVDINFEVEDYPRFQFLPLTEDIKTDVMETWTKLVDKEIVTRQEEDESHIRTLLEFPQKAEETPEIGEGPEEDDEPEDTPDDDPEAPSIVDGPGFPVPNTETAKPKTHRINRAPNRFEKKVDFKAIDRGLDEIQREARDEIAKRMVNVRDLFLKTVERKFDGTAKFVTSIDADKLRGMPRVSAAIGEFLDETMDFGVATVRRELQSSPGRSARLAEEPNFSPSAAAKFLRAKKLLIAGVISEKVVADAKVVLLRAIETGEAGRETQQKLRAVFDPYTGDPNVIRDGDVISPARLENIIRTNATDVFNRGRVLEARASGDLVQGFEYSAILDSRTTEVCASLDGRVFRRDDPAVGQLKPPRHFQCRSILVPVTIDVPVEESDFITPGQIGEGLDLSGKGFK